MLLARLSCIRFHTNIREIAARGGGGPVDRASRCRSVRPSRRMKEKGPTHCAPQAAPPHLHHLARRRPPEPLPRRTYRDAPPILAAVLLERALQTSRPARTAGGRAGRVGRHRLTPHIDPTSQKHNHTACTVTIGAREHRETSSFLLFALLASRWKRQTRNCRTPRPPAKKIVSPPPLSPPAPLSSHSPLRQGTKERVPQSILQPTITHGRARRALSSRRRPIAQPPPPRPRPAPTCADYSSTSNPHPNITITPPSAPSSLPARCRPP